MEEPKKKNSVESPLVILGTMALVVPVLAVCCAGPAVVASFLIGMGAWLDQCSPIAVAAAALVTGVSAIGIVRWHRRRHAQVVGACACGLPARPRLADRQGAGR